MDKNKSDEIDAYLPGLEKKPAAPVVTDSNEVAEDDANGDSDDERADENEAVQGFD